jgi:DNA-binding NtrC family response regulator
VADDEIIITKSTSRFLERFGYRAITAFDGIAAMELFRKHMDEIAMVLLDLEMPGKSGRECMAEMQAMAPSVKIVALSGHLIRAGEWEPVRAGAAGFVQKPYDSEHLLGLIRQILDHPREQTPKP